MPSPSSTLWVQAQRCACRADVGALRPRLSVTSCADSRGQTSLFRGFPWTAQPAEGSAALAGTGRIASISSGGQSSPLVGARSVCDRHGDHTPRAWYSDSPAWGGGSKCLVYTTPDTGSPLVAKNNADAAVGKAAVA